MIRILLLLGFIFYTFPSLAKIVTVKVSFMHGEEISAKDGCKLARERVQLKALQEGLNVTISTEESEKCSQIDGKSNCEYNQFSLITFNGVLTDVIELDKKKRTEELSNGDIAYICEIEIQANAKPIKQITDPNFNFNVKLNEYNYRVGDNLTMEINVTKPMYLTIFQFLPYIEKNYQIYKLFPDENEDNYIKGKKLTLPHNGAYQVSFPEQINKENVDEYLFFIASDEKINWLNEYNNINELKSSYIDSTKRVKTKYKQYTIYK